MENLLKKRRLEKRLTLEQVGDMVGVGKSTVRKWENGMIENMGRDKIISLSKALDISPFQILEFDEKEKIVSTTKTELDNVFGELEDKRKLKVVDYAKTELSNQNQSKVINLLGYSYDFYDNALNAGTAQFIGSSQIEKVILAVDIEADYVVPIRGTSMEPDYYDGDYVFIQSTVKINDGEIGVFDFYGDGYIKQLVLNGNKGYLRSLNSDYKDIPIEEELGNNFKVVGRVVGRYTE
ncbi:XRE family transcriptional regulator [Lactococcus carnosus]|uniref:Helix-turn-helix domain-containing protein n=1 Tax=Pseudolactococcus carnosus TaxID=2749961 RepID=A0ABT0APR9_9LACT|nr:S24 family peptidase [Lactococcus carnosus]MCJ1988695.1 helix-turn-helix domain-containing protein [Lactococcus carnosus]